LLGQMKAEGGTAAQVADLITAPTDPKLNLRIATPRHDSPSFVAASNHGQPDPARIGYFVGTNYGDTLADSPDSFSSYPFRGSFRSEFGPDTLLLNVTRDPGENPPLRNPDADLKKTVVHESVHAMDRSELPHSEPLER